MAKNENKTKKNNKKSKFKRKICPECGEKLVERIGTRGRFLGCQNYPKCKYASWKKPETN